MKRLFNIMVLCTLLLSACDEEEDNIIDYPITLHMHDLSRASNIRLFVNKKEIYNSNIIKSFIGNSEYFKLPTNTDLRSSNESIYFLSEDSVLFGTSPIGFIVKKNANQFLFYSPKILQVNNEYNIVYPLLKYTDELIPVSSGINFGGYLTGEVRVGYGSYKNLEICFLSYMLLKNEGSYKRLTSGQLLNEFNEEAINTLGLRDTLAIREYRIRFIAK